MERFNYVYNRNNVPVVCVCTTFNKGDNTVVYGVSCVSKKDLRMMKRATGRLIAAGRRRLAETENATNKLRGVLHMTEMARPSQDIKNAVLSDVFDDLPRHARSVVREMLEAD